MIAGDLPYQGTGSPTRLMTGPFLEEKDRLLAAGHPPSPDNLRSDRMVEVEARSLEPGLSDLLGLTVGTGPFVSAVDLWPLLWGGRLSVARWRKEDLQ